MDARRSTANGRPRPRSSASLLGILVHALLLASGCGGPLDDGADTEAATSGLASCAPQRAAGVVSPYERALLDTIATTEGTYRWDANDGYDVAFGYHVFSNCTQHPRVVYCDGPCSDASGRYQFLSSTWDDLGYPAFYPNYQDQAALRLARVKRSAYVPSTRAMTYGEFVAAMGSCNFSTGQGLALEWASLPPGCYGQPSRTMAEAWQIYSGFAANAGRANAFDLHPGQSRKSGDGRFTLTMQSDGNLVLYGRQTAYTPERALWSSRTNGKGGAVTSMQTDGNLVVYRSDRAPLWASGTYGHPGARLAVQNDGNTVIYDVDGAPLWATRTVQPAPPRCSATEQYYSDYGGNHYWTCDLNGGSGRFICDGNGYKTHEGCAHGCAGQGVGHDDLCRN